VATSKNTEFAVLSSQHLGIDRYIDLVVGDDKVTYKKPHPEMLHLILSHLHIDTSQAAMIGDAVTGIQMGNAAGMDTIAVTWGAHPEALLRAAHPTRIVHQLSDLLT
jgi:phosphoglycolate phosphatase